MPDGTECWPTGHDCGAEDKTGDWYDSDRVAGYGRRRRCADCACWFRKNDAGEGFCLGQRPNHPAFDTDEADACPQFAARAPKEEANEIQER